MTGSGVRRVSSPVGDLLVAADATGLLLCDFSDGRDVARNVRKVEASTCDEAMVDRVVCELVAYFAGGLRAFTIPLPAIGRPFQQAAWRELLAIPFGQTRSYGRQAEAVGNPKAVRAVARANASNCRAIVIPCHRVIGSGGKLTGFSGGLHRKQWLLDHERVRGSLS